MYRYKLSHLILFARIAPALLFSLLVFLVISKCSPGMGSSDAIMEATMEASNDSKYDLDQIVFAARKAEIAGGLVHIYHEDGTFHPTWESLANLQRKLGLYYVNAYTIVNLEKGCYRRLDGEHVWSTTLGDVRITRHFFNRNNRDQLPSCP
jgi:hypothetical protein